MVSSLYLASCDRVEWDIHIHTCDDPAGLNNRVKAYYTAKSGTYVYAELDLP